MVDQRFETAADDRSALQTGIENRFCEPFLKEKVLSDRFLDLTKPLQIATAVMWMQTRTFGTTTRKEESTFRCEFKITFVLVLLFHDY